MSSFSKDSSNRTSNMPRAFQSLNTGITIVMASSIASVSANLLLARPRFFRSRASPVRVPPGPYLLPPEEGKPYSGYRAEKGELGGHRDGQRRFAGDGEGSQ